jgi:transcriptional regulator with XRE-family HTH domain
MCEVDESFDALLGKSGRGPLLVEFGRSIRRLRRAAGLTCKELAGMAEVTQPTISKVENGQMYPSEELLRQLLGAVVASGEQRAQIVSLYRSAAEETRVRRKTRYAEQGYERFVTREQAARRVRYFAPTVLPDLLQAPAYLRATVLVEPWYAGQDPHHLAARQLDRQGILFDLERRFEFVIAESVFRDRRVPAAAMRTQIDRVLWLLSLDNLTLGIIPTDVPLPRVPWCSFTLLDESVLGITGFSGATFTTDPTDLAAHTEAFGQLAAVAEHDQNARVLLMRIAADLPSAKRTDTTGSRASP